jgi:Nucleotidyl transferase AbiEii toxin, Type IV TA system
LTFFLSRSESFGPELAGTPDHFILYGGTAIALRLGHRQSVDFDFFSPVTFEPHSLLKTVPYLKEATVRKSAPNDLAVTVDRGGPVQLSFFFGNFDLGQVAEPELAEGSGIKVASLIDLAGMNRRCDAACRGQGLPRYWRLAHQIRPAVGQHACCRSDDLWKPI